MEITTLEPLSLEELEAVAGHLGREKWLKPDDRQAFIEGLETTAIIRSQRAWKEITQASISLFLIREYGLYLGRENELGLPMETWEQYLNYMGRRGMARSTAFKHLASLMVFHKGLGRDLFGALKIPGGVQSLDHIKALVKYDIKTGEILGPKKEVLLDRLPRPDEDLATRLNEILDGIETGGPGELELSPRSVAKLLRQDFGGEAQTSFFWTLGPFGEALGWYYCDTNLASSRGIVGLDIMPPEVAHKLRLWARVAERDPTPFAEQLKEDKMYLKVSAIGHVGNSPELRYSPSGSPVTNFSLAINRKWTNQDGTPGEETVWLRVSCWNRLAEVVSQYVEKGRQVFVEGRLKPDPDSGGPRVYTRQDGSPGASFEIVANSVIFLGRGAAREEPEEKQALPDDEEMELPF